MRLFCLPKILGSVAVSVCLTGGAANAAVIAVSPVQTTASIGDTVNVDIVISGLVEPVGSASLKVSFDQTILTPVSYTIGPALGVVNTDYLDFSLPTFIPFDIYVTSLLTVPELAASQGAGFTLVRLQFTAAADGVSPIALQDVDLSDANGLSLQQVTSSNGAVCVGGPCPVPEPVSTGLLLAGLLAVGLRRAVRG